MYAARILADSIAPNGVRLTTVLATYPHVVHQHVLTHRMLTRSTASSRAVPVTKMIAAVRANPYIPEAFGANQPGMQAGLDLDSLSQSEARSLWLSACETACERASQLAGLGVHKQWANRLIEPYAWSTCLITATEWANFYALRCHADAQPEIRKAAVLMRDAMAASKPRALDVGDWHLPFVTDDERNDPANAGIDWIKVSVGRCARVSTLKHDGTRDPAADIALADKLRKAGHWSPWEHVATPQHRGAPEFHGNLRGWVSVRKQIPGEAVFVAEEVVNG